MKNLYHYLSNIEKSRTSLQEGQSIDFVLNEEYSIRTDIVAVDGRDVYVGLDRRAYELLERAGVMEAPIPAAKPNQINLAQSNQTMSGAARANAPAAAPAATGAASLRAAQNRAASGTTGTATATPAAAAAAPAPSGARNTTAGAKPASKSASTTNANVKAANAAFVKNQQNAAVDDANKVQAAQTAAVSAANQPAAAADSGANAATAMASKSAATEPKPQPNAFGVMPQADIPGSPTGTSAAPSTSAPASTFGGVQPQADIPGSPTGTSAAAPATATKSLPITTTGGPTAANPASVNPATQGGPAVTGGFGQETNITTDSPDQIAKRGPMGTQPQATKSYASVGDFAGAVGDKLKNTFGGGSAPAAPAAPPPATIEEAPRELDRVLQLAGVKRG